jgi:hypothetical protein
LDGSLGLQVCPKIFFSSAMYSPLLALSSPILKKMSQKFFFQKIKFLKKLTLNGKFSIKKSSFRFEFLAIMTIETLSSLENIRVTRILKVQTPEV